MRLWSRFRSWWSVTLRRARMESEMDAEIRFHIEAYAADLMRGGIPRQEALRRARVEGVRGAAHTPKQERGAP